MTTLKQNVRSSVGNNEKQTKNIKREGENMEKTTKNGKNGVKSTDPRPLKEQYEELKKRNSALVNRTRETAKGEVTEKPKTVTKEEVTPMTQLKDWRKMGEEVLLDVCKEFKVAAERVKPKANSNQVGTLRVKVNRQVLIAVRATDIIVYNPQSYLGVGEVHPGDYGLWITKMEMCNREDMRKGFVKALKNKIMPHTYRDQSGFVYTEKAAAVKETAEDKAKRLRAELAELEASLVTKKETKKQGKKETKPKKGDQVLARVAKKAGATA